jgi:hypothetical protein
MVASSKIHRKLPFPPPVLSLLLTGLLIAVAGPGAARIFAAPLKPSFKIESFPVGGDCEGPSF